MPVSARQLSKKVVITPNIKITSCASVNVKNNEINWSLAEQLEVTTVRRKPIDCGRIALQRHSSISMRGRWLAADNAALQTALLSRNSYERQLGMQ